MAGIDLDKLQKTITSDPDCLYLGKKLTEICPENISEINKFFTFDELKKWLTFSVIKEQLSFEEALLGVRQTLYNWILSKYLQDYLIQKSNSIYSIYNTTTNKFLCNAETKLTFSHDDGKKFAVILITESIKFKLPNKSEQVLNLKVRASIENAFIETQTSEPAENLYKQILTLEAMAEYNTIVYNNSIKISTEEFKPTLIQLLIRETLSQAISKQVISN